MQCTYTSQSAVVDYSMHMGSRCVKPLQSSVLAQIITSVTRVCFAYVE